MKFLIITRYYHPVKNGMSDHTALIQELLQDKCDSLCIVCEKQDGRQSEKAFGARNLILYEYANRLELFTTITAVFKHVRPDVVLFQYVPHMWGREGFAPLISLLPLWIKFRYSKPVISYLHELFYDFNGNLKKRILAMIHRIQLLFIGLGSRSLIVTNYRREKLLQNWWSEKTICRIPAGNVSGRKADHVRNKIYTWPYITWFGTLSEDQQLDKLVEAFEVVGRKYTDLRLILVGGFDRNSNRVRAVQESQIMDRIMIRGFVNDDELSDILYGSSANLFIAASGPSGRRGVIGAYLRSGRPIIAIDGHETDPEFKNEENVLLINNSVSELTKSIDRILSDKTTRKKLEQGEKKLFNDCYSDEAISKKLKKLLAWGGG